MPSIRTGIDKEAIRAASPLEQVYRELTGHQLRKVSTAELAGLCPFHDDSEPSLNINPQKQTWTCRASCGGGDVFVFVERVKQTNFKGALAFLAERAGIEPEPVAQRHEVAVYPYRDETGAVLYEAVRYEPKDFRQRRPDGNGGYIWNLNGTRRVIYRLPELKGKEAAVIVEGEKDVDRLLAEKVPATCNVGGAGKWRDEYTEQLKAAGVQRVIVIPDNDGPGRAHAGAVARSCSAAGLTVKVLTLPDLSEKGDVSDYLQTHSRADLRDLLRAAPECQPTADEVAPDADPLAFTSLGALLREPDEVVNWVVEGRIPGGGLSMVAGKPKTGKSTMVRALAFCVATGKPWLGWHTSPGVVWYLALEEKRGEVRRHFRAMGATGQEPINFFINRAPEDVLVRLHERASVEKPALIVLDTVQRVLRCKDMNDYAEVTTKMEPLLAIARETGAALLLVHHAGKSPRAGIDAVLGSTALAGSVDNVFILGRSDQQRLLCTVQRIGDDLEETILTLDKQSQQVSLGLTRHEAEDHEIRQAILAALRTNPNRTEAQLSEDVEGRTEAKRRLLRKLCAEREVCREGGGKRNQPYTYRLPDSCFVVPTYIREQENKKPEIAASSSNGDTYSCSRKSADLAVSSETREQETDDVSRRGSWLDV